MSQHISRLESRVLLSSATPHAPTNITVSPTAIAENSLPGTTFATLSTTDVDSGDTFAYTLVAGTGSGGNGQFTISGNQLRANNTFDYETKTYYNIRVRSTDQGGLWYEKSFRIDVVDLPEPLVINGTSAADTIALAASSGNLIVTNNGVLKTYNLATQTSITVNCLAGDDSLTLGSGVPQIVAFGGDGDDTLIGGDGNDTILAGAGNDLVHGGSGHDALRGEDGNDTVYGDLGDDRLYGDKGFDLVYGGDGNDRLDGGTGNDTLWGGRNADYETGTAGYDLLYGEDGKDTLLGGDQNDTLDAGAGWDSLDGGTGDDLFYAIDATAYADTLYGGGGNDTAHINDLVDQPHDIASLLFT